MHLLCEGETVSGTYEVERFISEGAFGEVYRVKHPFLGRLAMKVFKLPTMPLAEARQMLEEAFMLSRIAHPNIISVFDAGMVATSQGDCPFFTMEFVAGGTLQDYWKSFGAAFVPVEQVVDVMRQVCRGLAVAHSGTPPLVHRDIKPQNILVGYDGMGIRVRLADFGLAKRANPLSLQLTGLGTLPFKAPEVFLNSKGDSCAGDVWAVGCTTYLLLTDRLPWRGGGRSGAAQADRTLGFVPPREFNPKVDPVLERITTRALAWEPAERYADARPLLADLELWRPLTAPVNKPKDMDSDMMKTALGPVSSLDETRGVAMKEQALQSARHPAKLMEAADLMEEAFKHLPSLREQYEYRVQVWRRGLTM
jgi:eukaryotic-like serine/threonine-protein kinase